MCKQGALSPGTRCWGENGEEKRWQDAVQLWQDRSGNYECGVCKAVNAAGFRGASGIGLVEAVENGGSTETGRLWGVCSMSGEHRRRRAWLPVVPHPSFDCLCFPIELVVPVEVFGRPRASAASVRHLLPHDGGAEGLGRVEGGGGVTGSPAHWEGTEPGEGRGVQGT